MCPKKAMRLMVARCIQPYIPDTSTWPGCCSNTARIQTMTSRAPPMRPASRSCAPIRGSSSCSRRTERSGRFPCSSRIRDVGWRSALTYEQVAATGIARSLEVLAYYGDLAAATAVVTANPSLADDPGALAAAAEHGHEAIVRLLLRHQPRLAERVAVAASTRELT